MNEHHWMKRASAATLATLNASENRTRVLALAVRAGSGAPCSYCHKSIDATAVEYEVQAYVHTKVRTLHFHRICHHLWESIRSDRPTSGGSSGYQHRT